MARDLEWVWGGSQERYDNIWLRGNFGRNTLLDFIALGSFGRGGYTVAMGVFWLLAGIAGGLYGLTSFEEESVV